MDFYVIPRMREIEKLNTDDTAAISHLQFFPCIKQLVLFEKLGRVSIDVFENFPKQTFRNRTVVLSSQGLLNIIVPTKKVTNAKIIMRDVEISYSQRWNTEAWRTIFSCYGKSPFFIYYADKVKEILFKQHRYLIDLNLEIFGFLKKTLRLTCDLTVTSRYSDKTTDNYRDMFLPKTRSEDGMDLIPYYQCFSPATVMQNNVDTDSDNGFYTNLSALDLLFNLGNESPDYIRNAIRQLHMPKDMKTSVNNY